MKLKLLILTIFTLISTLGFSQKQLKSLNSKNDITRVLGEISSDSAIVFPKDTIQLLSTDRAIACKNNIWYTWSGTSWVVLLSGTSQIQSDWNQTNVTLLDYIKNKPSLFSGSYTDLTSKPTIPAQFNPIAGTAIGITGTYPNITFNATVSGGGTTTYVKQGYATIVDSSGGAHTYTVSVDTTKLKDTLYYKQPIYVDHDTTKFNYTVTDSLHVQDSIAITTKENSLGNPSTNGYVLSSTTGGVRSWIAQGSSGNDTAMVHIDSIAGHPSWVQFYHSNRLIPSDTLKFNIPPTVVSFSKNATRDSAVITMSNGSQMAVKDSVGAGSGSSSLSSLTAATVPNSITNSGLALQTWNWPALDTTVAFYLTANGTGTTTGGASPILLRGAMSGANSATGKTTYTAYFTNSHTGTSSTNFALIASSTGGTYNNAAGFVGNVSISSTAIVPIMSYGLDVRSPAGFGSGLATGSIIPYSGGTITNFTGLVTMNKGISVLNYAAGNNYDFTRAGAVGYAAVGNDVLSTTGDTTTLKINGNSVLKNIGVSAQNVQISDSSVVNEGLYNYNINAILDVSSTTKAFLPPRLTTTQRDAMVLTGAGFGVIAHSAGSTTTSGILVNVALTGGSGSGAYARIICGGAQVTTVLITTPGTGYAIGDVLTATLPGTLVWTYTLTQLTGVPGMQIFNKTTGKYNFLNNSLVWEVITSM